ncbi:hypothetical protein [Qipengyuania sediminis]|uniref:hypothetical protein n=1 Tax=Qipengyuania sediminis TaxID=1532023 RepID=UPI001059396D|nr:hypothetical protein [Qipengyuania sediminis]
MSMLLMSAALSVVSIAQIDLTSPAIFISKETRGLIAAGAVRELTCGTLPERNGRAYRIACLTNDEVRRGSELAAAQDNARKRSRDGFVRRSLGVDGARSLAARGGPRS